MKNWLFIGFLFFLVVPMVMSLKVITVFYAPAITKELFPEAYEMQSSLPELFIFIVFSTMSIIAMILLMYRLLLEKLEGIEKTLEKK